MNKTNYVDAWRFAAVLRFFLGADGGSRERVAFWRSVPIAGVFRRQMSVRFIQERRETPLCERSLQKTCR
ncbi:hypothetical protein QQF64_018243 [Cirrhinus molitorella]|uniref:Uncharacterized protein n=1 Tax=Cirrhinus molitorella TaxID=172907 RepID=A0ABR3LKV5_9TELE